MAETPSTSMRLPEADQKALAAWGAWLASEYGGAASKARAVSWLLRRVEPPKDFTERASEVRQAVKEL